MRVETGAGSVGVDLVGCLLLGPAVRHPVGGPRAQPVAAGELDGDLVVCHAHRAHPGAQLLLLDALAGLAHAAVLPP